MYIFRWICIYPAYFNSNKTRQEGRLLSKDKCVSDPGYEEIHDVLKSAGFQPIGMLSTDYLNYMKLKAKSEKNLQNIM